MMTSFPMPLFWNSPCQTSPSGTGLAPIMMLRTQTSSRTPTAATSPTARAEFRRVGGWAGLVDSALAGERLSTNTELG
jgi:hypothetical protein